MIFGEKFISAKVKSVKIVFGENGKYQILFHCYQSIFRSFFEVHQWLVHHLFFTVYKGFFYLIRRFFDIKERIPRGKEQKEEN